MPPRPAQPRLPPQVGNLGLLFMLLFFIYAALGVELFGKLGERLPLGPARGTGGGACTCTCGCVCVCVEARAPPRHCSGEVSSAARTPAQSG